MALINLGREIFNPNDTLFNTNFQVMYLDTTTNEIVFIDSKTNVKSATIGNLTSVVAALNQATFATAPYIAMTVGTTIAVKNYNATAKSCVVQKISVAAGTYEDWIIISTEAVASTGANGYNPI